MATPSDANNFVPEIDPEGAALTPEEAHAKEDNDAKRLAERCRLEFIDLTSFQPDQELFQSVPVDLMFRYNFLPYRKEDGKLVIVTADPTNVVAMDEVASFLNMPVRAAVGTDTAIQELLKKSQSAQRVLEEASESFHMEIIREDEEGEETLSIDRLTDTSSPIIRLVDSAVYNALNRRASDIHIETRDEEVVIKYRIDGALTRAMKPIPKAHHSEIISRIKVMAELDIAEKRVPQDGRFRLKIKGRRIDFRVSIMPSIHGEDAVIRILDKESISEKFTELRLDILGMAESEVKSIRRFIHEPYGMFLVTGPTGSGKTTTLYAALSEIYNEEDKIITIEDPVEYQLVGITQIPINEKKGLTFSRGLRSILRHDPDKVMVGEIRDAETAQIAINAAQAIEDLILMHGPKTVAAVIGEAVAQPPGAVVPGDEYWPMVRDICDRYGVLLIADEIICGFGRTGTMFGMDNWDVVPDIMSVGKGISSSYLPLSATVATDRVYDAFYDLCDGTKTLFHGHTFAGNPICCAAALASLRIFEAEPVLERVRRRAAFLGALLHEIFADHPWVGQIRQQGLMVGLELVRDRTTRESFPAVDATGWRVCRAARDRGVFVRPLGDVVVIMPPLSIEEDELAQIVEAVRYGLHEVGRGHVSVD